MSNFAIVFEQAYQDALAHSSFSKIHELISQSPRYAYNYALNIDRCPHEETRVFACKDSYYAYLYAKEVDKCPHEETRNAVCRDSLHAFLYARDIDKCPMEETWLAVIGTEFEEKYRKFFDRFH